MTRLLSDGCTQINPTSLLIVLLLSPPVGTFCFAVSTEFVSWGLFPLSAHGPRSGGFAGLTGLFGVNTKCIVDMLVYMHVHFDDNIGLN